MHWRETEADEALWGEWKWLVGCVTSTTFWLESQFSDAQTEGVLSAAQNLVAEVEDVHAMARVLHLVWPPVINVAAETDVAAKWNEVDEDSQFEDDPNDFRSRQSVSAAFRAVADCAIRECHAADSATCGFVAPIEDDGSVSLDALAEMAAAVQRLVAWAAIYVEAAIGFYGQFGMLPSNDTGLGTSIEIWEYEQVEVLRLELAASG